MAGLKEMFGLSQGNSRSNGEYAETELSGSQSLEGVDENVDYYVQKVNVSNKQDVVEVKDQLQDGVIVLMNITDDASVSPDQAAKTVKKQINSAGGDIVRLDTDLYLATPASVGINRNPI